MCLHFFNFLFLAFNRFFDMVNSITEEIGKTTEEGECDGDSLEVHSVFFVVFFKLIFNPPTIMGFYCRVSLRE